MTKPAFIVEGYQEQKIVQRLCPKAKVVLLGINGNRVNIDQIFKRIKTHFRIFNNRHYPIFVIFDREDRSISCDKIVKELNCLIEKNGIDKGQFIFGIPDRKIESWILPFIDNDGNFLDLPAGDFEGSNCIGKLENRLEKTGSSYNKSTNGVLLFTQIDPGKLATVSKSFASFYHSAKVHCNWMRR